MQILTLKLKQNIFTFFTCFLIVNFFNFGIKAQSLEDVDVAIKEQNYEYAKTLIDGISQTDSLQSNTKMWFFRGKIYANIADDIRGIYTDLDSLALFKAYDAFQKVLEISEDEYLDSAKLSLKNLHITALNDAGKDYKLAFEQSNKGLDSLRNNIRILYQKALKTSELAIRINPSDTVSYKIAAFCALSIRDYNKYIIITENWIEQIKTIEDRYIHYESLAAICRDKLRDTVKTTEILDLALRDFPNDEKFQQARLKLNVENNNEYNLVKDAKAKIWENPKDPLHYFNLAVIYQKFQRWEDAIDSYEKCIKLDPSNFDAIFYIAGIYFNRGTKLLKEINRMNFTEYQQKGILLDKEANESFRKSLPYFEKLNKMNPSNEAILGFLSQVYQRLGLDEKVRN